MREPLASAGSLVVLGLVAGLATPPRAAAGGGADASATIVAEVDLPSLGQAEVVSEGHQGLEGPLAWPGDSGDGRGAGILFSDVSARKILFFDPVRGDTRVMDPASGGANGLALHERSVYRCEGAARRIARSPVKVSADGRPELAPGVAVVETVPGGRPHFTNDLVVSGGILFFTDPIYGPRPEGGPEVEGVYGVPLDVGALGGPDPTAVDATLLLGDLTRPNGITVGPAGRWLYVADEGSRALHRYEILSPDGSGRPRLSEGTLFADVSAFGNPDGLVTDRAGRVYVALFETGALLVLSPEGIPLALTPAGERTSNVCLDAQERHAYVTAGGSLLRFALNVSRPAHEAPLSAGAP